MRKIAFLLLSVLLLSCGGEKKDATTIAEEWLNKNVMLAFKNPKIESITQKECKFDQTEVFNRQGDADNQRVIVSREEIEKYTGGDKSDEAVNSKFTINTLVNTTVDAYQKLLKNRPDYTEVTAKLSFDTQDAERGTFSYIILIATESSEVLNNVSRFD